MNMQAEKQESPAIENEVAVYATGTPDLILDNNTLDKIMVFADMMSKGVATLPKHLHKNPSDCAAVVMQAMQWKMNPYAVAQKTHLVNGTLGYEAQLVNAVICASGLITGRFHYEYKGTSPNLECRAGAVPKGESEIVWSQWINESKITTKNSPLWKTNPAQQMGYLQVKNWARQYAPGAILGVYTNDELEEIPRIKDVTPIETYVTQFQCESIKSSLAKKSEKAVAAFTKMYGSPEKIMRTQYNEVMAMLDKTKDVEVIIAEPVNEPVKVDGFELPPLDAE
jgi:hypothetical protein